jgi:ribonuclease HI
VAKKQKFYVVWSGRKAGVYKTWAECDAQVKGFTGAQFKAFDTLVLAESAFQARYDDFVTRQPKLIEFQSPAPKSVEGLVLESYVVDAACSGNPGDLEYRCVHPTTREALFKQGPFTEGTNNIGEFLALVHALALLKRKEITVPVYSDSEVALSWVENKKCKTKLSSSENNKKLFELVSRAEAWLANNSYENEVLKWQTELWGENPADYGRK